MTEPALAEDDPLIADMTPPQRRAVTHAEGPLLVIAGPGSGKTRVITRRIAHLVRHRGVAPWQILAITFTNKAAREMRERVAELLSPRQAGAATIATFHSFCVRVLRAHADAAGLEPGFSIYDAANQKRTVQRALEQLELDTKQFPPGSVLGAIGQAKNRLQDPEGFATAAEGYFERRCAEVYRRYQRLLAQANAVDFDDLLRRTVSLLRERAEVREQLHERYPNLLVDEYQDTNHAQFVLSYLLAGRGEICVAGDPDQSIYGWRGAHIGNILEFESHFPGATTVRLEQNHRSSQRILACADGLIQNNESRKEKRLFSELGEGEPVELVKARDESHEAQWLLDRLRALHDEEGVPWGGMAIFYRTNALSRVLEEALLEAGIPYQMARGTAFYERKEIRDALAYLQVTANPADDAALLRIINTPARGISDKSIRALQARASEADRPLREILDEPESVNGLTKQAVKSIHRFREILDAWRGQLAGRGASLAELVEEVVRDSGLEAHYSGDKSDPDEERLANLGELVTSARRYEEELEEDAAEDPPTLGERLIGFLERVTLSSDVDAVTEGEGSVKLMTLHAAKGLEFPVVAIVGAEEGLLPHRRSIDDPQQMEEERRLCFVGMTRAQQRLFVTHARARTIFGKTMPAAASRFLRELPEESVRVRDATEELDPDAAPRSRRARRSAYAPGTLLRHPAFGVGKILHAAESGGQTKAQLRFEDGTVRTLILEQAPVERISI